MYRVANCCFNYDCSFFDTYTKPPINGPFYTVNTRKVFELFVSISDYGLYFNVLAAEVVEKDARKNWNPEL